MSTPIHSSWLGARAFSLVMVPLSACNAGDRSGYAFDDAAGGGGLGGGGSGAGGSTAMSGMAGAGGRVAAGGVSSAAPNLGGAVMSEGGGPTTVAKTCPAGEHPCVDCGASCEIPRFQLVPLPSGTTTSSAAEISADGNVVVGSMGSPTLAYRWPVTDAKATSLGLCTGKTYSTAAATNSTGSIVVGRCGGVGFHFTAPSTMKVIPVSSGWNYWPTGVSSNGSVVAGEQVEDTDPYFAFVWTNTVAVPTRIISIESSALAISGDGTVIVGNQKPEGGIRSAIWYPSGKGIQTLPGSTTLSSTAYGISTPTTSATTVR